MGVIQLANKGDIRIFIKVLPEANSWENQAFLPVWQARTIHGNSKNYDRYEYNQGLEQPPKTGKMLRVSGLYTDFYQLSMSQAYYLSGRKTEKAIFDYFFRKLPFDGGYAVFAGLEVLLEQIESLKFGEDDLEYLAVQGFDQQFLQYLRSFKFEGNIYSAREGDLVYPTRPVAIVEASLIEAQILETLLLNFLNYQTLIATKASRMRQAAGDRHLIDFGMRRAHGPAALHASRAAIIGGFNATSNVEAAKEYNIPVSGTMAHSFIQSFDDELQAFRNYAEKWPHDCILLVDTYDTLKSGVPNAVRVAREMEKQGHRLKGIRLDSGDLAYLAKKSRVLLDEAGLPYVKIAVSNQLDEYVIRSLLGQDAPIDVFGVGTSLVTGQPDAALDGVYKLAFVADKPRIKLSESIAKVTLPFKKQVHRIYNGEHMALGAECISLWDEREVTQMFHPFEPGKFFRFSNHKTEPLLHQVMAKGKRISPPRSLDEIAAYSKARLQQLPLEYKRFENPHRYKIGLSRELKDSRDQLIATYSKKEHYESPGSY